LKNIFTPKVIVRCIVEKQAETEVGDGVAYGSLFYVEEKLRGLGFGRRIFNAAAEVNDEVDHVVAIDAHDELEAMYQRQGYKTAFKVTQYEGTAIDNDTLSPDSSNLSSHCIKPVSDVAMHLRRRC
jgi:GNAT superfamily N-acetyltransferase